MVFSKVEELPIVRMVFPLHEVTITYLDAKTYIIWVLYIRAIS